MNAWCSHFPLYIPLAAPNVLAYDVDSANLVHASNARDHFAFAMLLWHDGRILLQSPRLPNLLIIKTY